MSNYFQKVIYSYLIAYHTHLVSSETINFLSQYFCDYLNISNTEIMILCVVEKTVKLFHSYTRQLLFLGQRQREHRFKCSNHTDMSIRCTDEQMITMWSHTSKYWGMKQMSHCNLGINSRGVWIMFVIFNDLLN